MGKIPIKGSYCINDSSEEAVCAKLLDFERRYQRHKKRWTIYVNKSRNGDIILQIRDHYREAPRGLKPTMPLIKMQIMRSYEGVHIKYCCKWPILYYFLLPVFVLACFLCWFASNSLRDGVYFLFVLSILAIPIIRFYSSDLQYKRDCISLLDELVKNNFCIKSIVDG